MHALLIKLTAAAAALLAAFAGIHIALPGDHAYSITGHFLSAEGVTAGNDVVIAGVPVGKVETVQVAAETDSVGGALIGMSIDARYAPLKQGTRATIRQKGFLGNMYIDLAPGRAGNASIPNRGTLPVQDTAAPVSLDQVMDVFDPNTRKAVKTLTLEGGKSLDGRGQDLNHILNDLPATSAQLADAAGNLGRSQQQLDDLAAEFDRITQQMASEDANLRGDLRNGASLLDSIAAREDRLQAEITYANQGLGKVNAGLGGHEQDLAHLLLEMPALDQHLRQLSGAVDPPLVDLNMCYPDIINAIAELSSATSYKHPDKATVDGNGYMLRVETFVSPVMAKDTGDGRQFNQLSCQGGTPTP